jgi:hypothetical protein
MRVHALSANQPIPALAPLAPELRSIRKMDDAVTSDAFPASPSLSRSRCVVWSSFARLWVRCVGLKAFRELIYNHSHATDSAFSPHNIRSIGFAGGSDVVFSFLC